MDLPSDLFPHLIDSSKALLGFWIWTLVSQVDDSYFGIGECSVIWAKFQVFEAAFFFL